MLGFTGCRDQIIHNLVETDANRVITTLSTHSIEAEKVRQPDGNWSIAVDRENTLEALRQLNDARILRDSAPQQQERSSAFGSRDDQRFRFERALSQEIAATLSDIPGVIDARVHLNLPLTDPLFGQPLDGREGTASVLLLVKDLSIGKEQIAQLVSGASGIGVKGVSVLISQAQTTATVLENKLPAATTSTDQIALQKKPIVAINDDKTTVSTATSESFVVRYRGMLIQIAASLVIVGVGLLWSFSRRKKAKTAQVFAL